MSKARNFKVILDGQEIGKVGNGKTVEFDVTPGQHTLQTGISKLEGISEPVTIEVDDSKDCVMVTKPNPLMLVAFLVGILSGVTFGKSLSGGFSIVTLVICAIIIAAALFFAFKKGVLLHPE